MKTIFFHVGMPKCGTSYIQNGLKKYNKEIESYGLSYPYLKDNNYIFLSKRHFSTGNGNPLVYGLLSIFEHNIINKEFNYQNIINDIINIITNSKFENFVISHEGLSWMPEKLIKILKKDLESYHFLIKVFFYIREPEKWLESDYQQHIKQFRIDHDVPTFLGERIDIANFYRYIERWEKVFGINNLIVKLMDNRLIENNLLYDFCKSIGFEIKEIMNIHMDLSNKGIDSDLLMILRQANMNKINDVMFKKLVKASIKFGSNSKTYRRFSFSDEMNKFIRVYHRNNIKNISEKYLSESETKIFLNEKKNNEICLFKHSDLENKFFQFLKIIMQIN